MPTFEVTSPEGKTFEVTAPAGATEAQVLAYAKSQFEMKPKGDPQAAERKSLEKENAEVDMNIPGTDVRIPLTRNINTFMVNAGSGMMDLWAGAKQMALGAADKISPRDRSITELVTGKNPSREEEFTKEYSDERKLLKPLEEHSPYLSAAGRITGQVAPTLLVPGGAAVGAVSKVPGLAMLARGGMVADAAIMGGALAGTNFVEEGGSRAGNVVGGAVLGGGAVKGLQMLARAPTAVKGAVGGGAAAGGAALMMDEPIVGATAAGSVAGALAARRAGPLLQAGASKLGLAEMAGTRAAVTQDDIAASLKSEGINFNDLTSKVRDGLVKSANDAAKAGAPVTPAELARVVRAENLPGGPASLTKGQMTGDRTQLREEFNLARTKAGESLDNQLQAQDKALADSIDVIKLKSGGVTNEARPAEAGEKITKPLLVQLQRQQGKVDSLYKAADESGETLATVDVKPLIGWLEDNFAAQHSAPAMKSLAAQLKKSGLVTFADDGEGIAAVAGREMTIREAESLRQAMNQWGKGSDASGHWMSEGKRVLDGITEGKGGDLYAKARAARIELREKFEAPMVINRLVGEKTGGDRVTAFEDVFKKTVLNGSVDDVSKLRGQLLEKGEDTAAGVQAFKDLRSATADYLKLGAMNNAKDEFSYAGFKRAVDSIGKEKMEVVFGKNTSKEIYNLLESAKDMKGAFNKTGVYNPGTASAIVDWIDRITGLVGMGKAASYATNGAKKVYEGLHAERTVENATKPVESAMREGAEAQQEAVKKWLSDYAGKAGARAAPAAVVPTRKDEEQ